MKTIDRLNMEDPGSMAEFFDANGVTRSYLLKKIKKELNAKETKFFQHEGVIMDQRDVIDWSTRQRARMDAHRLRGDYPAEKRDVKHSGYVILSPDEIEKPDDSGLGDQG